jgi:hypothetical protein
MPVAKGVPGKQTMKICCKTVSPVFCGSCPENAVNALKPHGMHTAGRKSLMRGGNDTAAEGNVVYPKIRLNFPRIGR